MIDSTKSPTAQWKKTATVVLLVVLIAVAGWYVWTKDLHKSSSGSSDAASTPALSVPAPAVKATVTTTTTLPGGVPESDRNPFGG